MRSFIASARPALLFAAWAGVIAAADWVPDDVLWVVTAGLIAASAAAMVSARDEHHKVVLIRTIIRQARDLQTQTALRRVK